MCGYKSSPSEHRMKIQLEVLQACREYHTKSTLAKKKVMDEVDDGTQERQEKETIAKQMTEEQQAKRALQQLRLGALGKAARTLASTPSTRLTAAEALGDLRDLHPYEPSDKLPLPSTIPPALVIKPADVIAGIRKLMSRCASPGIDGWTRELLVPLTEFPELMVEITAMVVDILECKVSASFATRVRAAAVTPLAKEGGGVRPITPESAWLKLASVVAFRKLPQAARKKYAEYQHGVWGDAAKAVKVLREAKQVFGNDTVVALDGTNAYNSVSRARILESVFSDPNLKNIWGITCLQLCQPGHLEVFEEGISGASLMSTSGIRQGMVLVVLQRSPLQH